MRVFLRYTSLAALVAISACAPKTVVAPVVGAPRFPDFVEPAVPADMAGYPAALNQERAWRFLQAGDLRNADREVSAALKLDPAFYPSETTSGYIELARKAQKAAVTRFDRALAARSDYVPALVGKGQALAALERDPEALAAFEAALAIDRSLTDVQRRVEVIRFRSVQREVASAREAARAGKTAEATRAYESAIASSPESPFLYRELAAIERAQGDSQAALGHYRQANALDPTDASSLVATAELLAERDELDAALKAYSDALAIEPNPEVEAARAAVSARAEYARLPPEFRAIQSASQISRADLAALIGQRLGSLLSATRPRDVGVITDVRGYWAERWILSVARAGVMDALPNHTFQPRTLIRRVDFAQAVTRLLSKVAAVAPAEARRWQGVRGRFSDLTSSHLAYSAASAATASGVMTTGSDGAFQPTRLVTGAEAIAALDRLALMTAPSTAPGPGR